jgi:hypothetical protein
MTHLFSLLPPIAWGLLFLVLLFNVSYLYTKNKNIGKVAIGLFVIIVVFVGWNLGQYFAEAATYE